MPACGCAASGGSCARGGARLGAAGAFALPHEEKVVARNWILVFLAQVFLVDEQVHVRRQRPRRLALEELDRARVLFSAEHQLGFLLAGRRLAPDRHRDGEHDRHHAEGNEQRDHGVAARAAQNCPAVKAIALLTR